MAILNLKKKVTQDDAKKVKKLAVVAVKSASAVRAVSGIFDSRTIIRPRVTEKATMLSEGGRTVAVFEVAKGANKRSVSVAIQTLYKVTPVKVAVLRVPPKKSFVRGHVTHGVTAYKAYVYLRPGEKIELA